MLTLVLQELSGDIYHNLHIFVPMTTRARLIRLHRPISFHAAPEDQDNQSKNSHCSVHHNHAGEAEKLREEKDPTEKPNKDKYVMNSFTSTIQTEHTSLAMSVYFCFSFGSRTAHQSARILVAPRLSRRGCSFRTRERWRLQNKRNAFIGRRARCSEDSSSSVSSASCSKPSAPRSGT